MTCRVSSTLITTGNRLGNGGRPAFRLIDAEITLLHNTLGLELPAEFIESLKVHNGCEWINGFGELLNVDGIIDQWQRYNEWQKTMDYGIGEKWKTRSLDGPVKEYWWGPKRIYVIDNSGDHVTLDLDPPEIGMYGQVLDHCHETGPKNVIANGWYDFLADVPDHTYD